MKLLLKILSFIGNLIPKSRNVWVFGSWDGTLIKDNSKDLFIYIGEHKDLGILGVFVTKNKSLIDLERRILYTYSIKGIYYQLIAGKYFMTTSYTDLSIFSFLSPKKSVYIQLWHGTPLKRLKKIGWSQVKIKLHKYFIQYLGRQYDFVLTTGGLSTELMKNYFNPEVKFLDLGFPRNDTLILNGNPKKIISIIPTFRPYKYSLINQLDFKRLSLLVSEYHYTVIIKIHPKEVELFGAPSIEKYKNIIIDKSTDTYDLLNETEILITDYSSIFIDFLLKDKPIIFSGFDLQRYENEVGLLMDYSEMPGYLTRNYEELEGKLSLILQGVDEFRDKRKNQINNYYSEITPACPRIVQYFISK